MLKFVLLTLAVAAAAADAAILQSHEHSTALVTINYQELQVLRNLHVSELYLIERGWFISKIKDVIGSIASKFRIFQNWIQTQFQHLLEVAKPHVEIMKDMAIEFIKEMTKAAVEAVLEAGYEYFREHQSEIGEELWMVIEALYRKFIEGHLQKRQIEDFSVEKFDRHILDGCSAKYLLTEGFFLQSIKDVINSIKDKFMSFKNWIAKQLQGAWDAVQPQVDTLKEMAIIFLKEVAKMTAEAVIEAGYEYFRERQNEIGEDLWKLVEAAYRKFLEGKLQ